MKKILLVTCILIAGCGVPSEYKNASERISKERCEGEITRSKHYYGKNEINTIARGYYEYHCLSENGTKVDEIYYRTIKKSELEK